jgi:hypothetical protein
LADESEKRWWLEQLVGDMGFCDGLDRTTTPHPFRSTEQLRKSTAITDPDMELDARCNELPSAGILKLKLRKHDL